MPGDWIGQTAANSAMGQYIIALAKLAGVKTLNVVRRGEAAEQVRQWGGDRVVLQGDSLHKDIEEALDGKKLSLVLDSVGGIPVGELAKALKTSGSIVWYGAQSGQFPPSRPKTSSSAVLASTDSGSSIGYATRPAQRSRRFTRSWATS